MKPPSWSPGRVGGLVLLAIGGVAFADYRHTAGRLPPIPPPCASGAFQCEQGRSELLFQRLDVRRALGGEYNGRVWIYGLGVALTVAAVAAAALRARPSATDARRIFANVGVSAILLGLIGAVVLLATGNARLELHAAPVFFPAAALAVGAAIGGSAARARGAAPIPEAVGAEAAPQAPTWTLVSRQAALVAVALTVVTVVLAKIYTGPQPNGCDDYSTAPGWTGAVGWAAMVTAAAAAILAIAGLPARRWVLALICLIVNPAALLAMLLSTGVGC